MRRLDQSLIFKADCYIDEHHDEFADLGGEIFRHFGSDLGKVSSQVRNLQQIALSATRLADVEDFVKNQMGKDGAKKNPWREVGDRLLDRLRQLRECSEWLDEDSANQLALRLRLVRGWVRAVVSEYLYRVALDQMRGKA